MGKRYEAGRLVAIECDDPSCDATIKPSPEIVNSGWRKYGLPWASGETSVLFFCPEHAISDGEWQQRVQDAKRVLRHR